MGWRGVVVSLFLVAGVAGGAYAAYDPNLMAAGQSLLHGSAHKAEQIIGIVPTSSKKASGRTAGTSQADQPAAVQSGSTQAGSTPPQSTPLAVTTNNAPPLNPVVIDGVHLPYNPYQPSDGPYPVLNKNQHVWIDVSIDQQLVYIFDGNHLLYTMITSSGIDTSPDTSTPLGVYHIQPESGTWFYAPQYQEGAEYWVSWLGNGVFLFHSVPEDIHHKLLVPIAAKLGHPASHGCFHLTIPDAKWIYDNINTGTTVVVEQAPVKLLEKTIYDPSTVQQAAIAASNAADQASAASTASAAGTAAASSTGTSASTSASTNASAS